MVRDPETVHVGAVLELVGFFLVDGAGGGPELGFVFPAGVFVREGDEGFGFVGEGEECLGEVEHGGDC